MGPKKAPETSIVGEYDVELMNSDELKMYIAALEEELKRMWSACNVHQNDNREYRGFLKLSQEHATGITEEIFQANVKIQESLNEINEELKSEDKLHAIIKIESNENDDREALESFVMVKTEEAENFKKEGALRTAIEEKDRQINDVQLSWLFTLIDLKEKKEESSSIFCRDLKNAFDDFVQQYLVEFQQKKFDFHEKKMAKLTSILEGDYGIQFLKNNAASDIEKMEYYFRDIFWKNIRIFDELNEEKSYLKKEYEKLRSSLNAAKQKNRKVQLVKGKKAEIKSNIDVDEDALPFNLKLEQLMYEHDCLEEKLRRETNEFNLLKERFIKALRDIRFKANFRTYLAEQKLISFLKIRPLMLSASAIDPSTTTDLRKDQKKIIFNNTTNEEEAEKVEEEKSENN
ncbi:uncharacterized protein LOC118203686 [Stegodyphus dumicola]|uniref:uncharacterized protein LOC118203686 n=1 Tax=Stegodyphus dumicola TaxID=202533 RepID=UPI0015AEAD9C|nr:uncharacterized protein LOC118203686 [Stegodyphus dumicola]